MSICKIRLQLNIDTSESSLYSLAHMHLHSSRLAAANLFPHRAPLLFNIFYILSC